MQSLRFWRTVFLGAACVVLAACGDSTAPTQEVAALDDLLSELQVAGSAGAAGLALSGGPVVSTTMPSAAQCPYNSLTQFFVCPNTSNSGLTFTLSYQLLDASGTVQSAFNAATTAAIRTVSDVSGTFTSTGSFASSVTMNGHNDQTLSGLLTGTHTLNGTGNSTSTMDLGGTTGTMTTSSIITGLVLPQRGNPNQYPQAGSIAMDITSNFGGGPFTSHIVISFDGTSTMTMVMTTNGFTMTCTVDMANSSATPSCR
jgi:hypothetical protein